MEEQVVAGVLFSAYTFAAGVAVIVRGAAPEPTCRKLATRFLRKTRRESTKSLFSPVNMEGRDVSIALIAVKQVSIVAFIRAARYLSA